MQDIHGKHFLMNLEYKLISKEMGSLIKTLDNAMICEHTLLYLNV